MLDNLILIFLFIGWLQGNFRQDGCYKKRYNVKEYGALSDGKTDDSKAFQKAIDAAIQSGTKATVFVPSGHYMLRTPMGRGMIQITKATGLTLEGEKGTLLISSDPTKDMINLDHSQEITVRNFELDRKPFVFTQGIVNNINALLRTVDVTIDKDYDEPDAKFLSGLKAFMVFTDPVLYRWDHSRWWPDIIKRERIAPMKWRFTLSNAPLVSYIDKPFLIWNNVYGGWGVVANRSKNCYVENIKYYGGGANGGIGIWGCDGAIKFKNFIVGIPDGSNRLLAAAGGSMEFENRGTVILDRCDFSKIDDDGFNMGSRFAKVLKQINKRCIVVEWKNIPYSIGDTIAVWDWFKKKERSQAKLTGVIMNKDSTITLTFDRDVKVLHPFGSDGLPLPSDFKREGRFEEVDGVDRIVDFQTAGRSIIRNCRFQSMRARCILSKTSNSIIEGNTFYNTHMAAILVGPEFYWQEGPAVHNLIIRNNRFLNIDGTSINIGCFASDSSYDNKDILIENNVFENYGAKGGVGISGEQGTAIIIRNSDRVVLKANTFLPSYLAPKGAKPVINERSKNVKYENEKGM